MSTALHQLNSITAWVGISVLIVLIGAYAGGFWTFNSWTTPVIVGIVTVTIYATASTMLGREE